MQQLNTKDTLSAAAMSALLGKGRGPFSGNINFS